MKLINPLTSTLNNSTATFQIKSAFQLTGRQFFILGDILSGEIKKRMAVDLTNIGINKKTIVEAIEFALHRDGDNVWEDVGLGISNLTETEKDFLKSQSPFRAAVLIEDMNTS